MWNLLRPLIEQPAIEVELFLQPFRLAAFAPSGACQEPVAQRIFVTHEGHVVRVAEIAPLYALFDILGNGQAGTEKGHGPFALGDVFR